MSALSFVVGVFLGFAAAVGAAVAHLWRLGDELVGREDSPGHAG
jgi:hypothetical protein